MYIIIVMECEREVHVNGLKFRIHPIYNQFAASHYGKYININNEAILLGLSGKRGIRCNVKAVYSKKYKSMSLQQFIFECYISIVPKGMKIVHSNGDFLDNRLSNLQIVAK